MSLISATLISAAVLFGTTVATKEPIHFDFSAIDLPGASGTTAFGINAEGDIVGQYTMAGMRHSYVLSEGTLTTIDPPFGISGTSSAQGINPEGDIVGQYTDHGTIVGGDAVRTRAYLRDASGTFTPIDFPGAENTFAIKISPTGQVVGCYHHQDRDFAVSGGAQCTATYIRTPATSLCPCLAPCTTASHGTAGLSLACGSRPRLNSTPTR